MFDVTCLNTFLELSFQHSTQSQLESLLHQSAALARWTGQGKLLAHWSNEWEQIDWSKLPQEETTGKPGIQNAIWNAKISSCLTESHGWVVVYSHVQQMSNHWLISDNSQDNSPQELNDVVLQSAPGSPRSNNYSGNNQASFNSQYT